MGQICWHFCWDSRWYLLPEGSRRGWACEGACIMTWGRGPHWTWILLSKLPSSLPFASWFHIVNSWKSADLLCSKNSWYLFPESSWILTHFDFFPAALWDWGIRTQLYGRGNSCSQRVNGKVWEWSPHLSDLRVYFSTYMLKCYHSCPGEPCKRGTIGNCTSKGPVASPEVQWAVVFFPTSRWK